MNEPHVTRGFDPNSASADDAGIFGLGCREEESALVFLPVPWEATTSYGSGTANGPSAILKASRQIDLYDGDVLKPYEQGLFLLPEDGSIRDANAYARAEAQKVLAVGGEVASDPDLLESLARVNTEGARLNAWVRKESLRLMGAGKIVGIVGGDHSVPFGAFAAAAQTYGEFGILHFDAHHDLRTAYEGFTWSHASILYNALERIPAIRRVVQVGIRDFCEQEWDYARDNGERVRVFYDRDIARRTYGGTSWKTIAQEIVAALPEKVWVTFDIDGLDPRFCPHTGTPVPGGFDFNQANYLLGEVVRSGRRILGFDLDEVAPAAAASNEWDGGRSRKQAGIAGASVGEHAVPEQSEWDANVGARVLYKLAGWTLASQGKARLQA